MTLEEKQSELNRYRSLVIATIGYMIERYAGSIIIDEFDPAADYYKQQKLQTEKYYSQRRLDRLQQQLRRLTQGLQDRADLEFGNYIKEKTGYDIDIFKDLRNRVAIIIAQKEIRNQKELNDVGTMLHFYQQVSVENESADILKKLLISYSKQTNKKKSAINGNRLSNQLSEAVSPDGKRKLTVGKSSNTTYVVIQFATASTPIFGTTGINPDIKAYWKDNSTIVIKTKKDYIINTKHKQVRSFEDIVNIEYFET